MGFSRHKYWSGLLCPPPEDLSDPEIKPMSLMSPDRFFTTSTTWKALLSIFHKQLIQRTPLRQEFHLISILWEKINQSLKWSNAAAAAAKSLQSCLTLCNPIDGSPPGSSVPGILQARRLEWVAMSFSNAWKWKVKVNSLSRVRLFPTPWTGTYQAPPSMGFSRQEYWSGLTVPSPKWSNKF